MEAIQSDFILIGKFKITKFMLMSEPPQLYVTNIETNECNLYRSHQLFYLLKQEKLDAEPLHEYFDKIAGITREERINILRKYDEWVKTVEERKQMKQEDKV